MSGTDGRAAANTIGYDRARWAGTRYAPHMRPTFVPFSVFLNALLDRPPHERPFLLLVVGYPAANARVPVITRKPLRPAS